MNKKENIKSKNKKTKNIIITVIILFSVLSIISIVLESGIIEKIFNSNTKTVNEKIFLYKPDYNLNIFEDKDYLNLDRYILYSNDGGISKLKIVSKESLKSTDIAATFFYNYFNSIINGNCNEYNTFFTDEYIKEKGPKVRFTMQMLYNMEVTKLREETINVGQLDQSTLYEFEVRYAIHKNNGTFRDDLRSDTTKPQRYILIKNDETNEILINAIVDITFK